MVIVKRFKEQLLDVPIVYSAWSSLFNQSKVSIIKSMIRLNRNMSVMDIGCGPGTNAALFENCHYVGIDISPKYIKAATRRFPDRQFIAADIMSVELNNHSFDLVMTNSMLHHMNDCDAKKLFVKIQGWLSRSGQVMILEPLEAGHKDLIKYLMMIMDRGKYIRNHAGYLSLFGDHFVVDSLRIVPLRCRGIQLGVADLIAVIMSPNKSDGSVSGSCK